MDRIMTSGKTNVTSNSVLAGHVDNFKSQMAEVLVIIILVILHNAHLLHSGHPGHPDHPAHLLHHQVVNIQEDLAGYRAALEQVFLIVNCHYCQNCHVPHICRFSSTSQIVAEYFSSTAQCTIVAILSPLATFLTRVDHSSRLRLSSVLIGVWTV